MQNITLMSTCDILKYHKFVKSTDNVDESIKILAHQKFHLSCHFLHISFIAKKVIYANNI